MKKNGVYYLLGVVVLLLLFVSYKVFITKTKIVIINSDEVLENYEGFKEAKDLYEIKIKEYEKTFEKQRKFYSDQEFQYNLNSKNFSKKEKEKKSTELKLLKENLLKLGKSIENKSKEEEDRLINGVYNKVNDFIERYSSENNIDAVLAIKANGNVLFASENIDVTKIIIEELNNEYLNGVEK